MFVLRVSAVRKLVCEVRTPRAISSRLAFNSPAVRSQSACSVWYASRVPPVHCEVAVLQ